jgi:hypothetical protein
VTTAVLIVGLVVAGGLGGLILARRARGRSGSVKVRMPGVDVAVTDEALKSAQIEDATSRRGGIRAEAEGVASIRNVVAEGDIVARAGSAPLTEKKTPR